MKAWHHFFNTGTDISSMAALCDYCGETVEKAVTCELCGATVGPDHKKEYGCYVCQGRVTV